MKKEKTTKTNNIDKFLNLLGILFLATGIIRFVVLLLIADLRYSIWFSNHVMLLLGIGVLMRNRFLVTAELCIALVPETLWSLDFLSKLLFNKHIFGVTEYIFEQGFNILTISSLQHLLIVPFGLIALYFLGTSSKGWQGSSIHIAVLWILGYLIGTEYNLNCIFRYCLSYFENLSNYMLAWPIIVLSMILLSNLILLALNFLKKK